MHTNRKSMRFGAQLSCKMSRGAHFDCAVSAGKIQYFHSKDICAVYDTYVINGTKCKIMHIDFNITAK